MLVSDLPSLLSRFASTAENCPQLTPSENPWRPKERHAVVPFARSVGVYLFSKPASPNWFLPLSKNNEEVWYIGKAEEVSATEPIAKRVWSHFGKNLQGLDPYPEPHLYPNHRWKARQGVPDDIKQSIVEGMVAVYTVEVAQPPEQFGWPARLESFLLRRAQGEGALPILNAVLPR